MVVVFAWVFVAHDHVLYATHTRRLGIDDEAQHPELGEAKGLLFDLCQQKHLEKFKTGDVRF